jgi:hypothetical protein
MTSYLFLPNESELKIYTNETTIDERQAATSNDEESDSTIQALIENISHIPEKPNGTTFLRNAGKLLLDRYPCNGPWRPTGL